MENKCYEKDIFAQMIKVREHPGVEIILGGDVDV